MRKGAEYHHGDLRRALVTATIELVDRLGPDGFTLRSAALRAGVSDAAPYHHFANKESLLAAVAEDGFQRLCAEMLVAAQRERGNARRKSQAMGVAYVLFAVRNPQRFRLMFGPLLDARADYPELALGAERAGALINHVLATGLHRSERGPTPRHVRSGAWALVHGLSILAIDGQLEVDRRDARALARLTRSALDAFDQASPRNGPEPRTARARRSNTGATSRPRA